LRDPAALPPEHRSKETQMPADSILLVMDMLNDLVHPDGMGAKSYVPLCRERGVYANTVLAIRRARAAGAMVGYVRVGFSPDYAECPPGSPVFSKARDGKVFMLGSWGTEVYADFAPQEGDPDIVKHRVSPFYGTRLEPLLRAQGIRRLILPGSRRTASSRRRSARGTTATMPALCSRTAAPAPPRTSTPTRSPGSGAMPL
jgi:hypothetical protein